MNVSLFCSCISFLLVLGYVRMESTECSETIKTEIKAVGNICFPNAEERFRPRPGQTPPPAPSPEETLIGFQCFVREARKQTELSTLISKCNETADSTGPEMGTFMICVGIQLNSTGCIPKKHQLYN